jgi:hypothetical protein
MRTRLLWAAAVGLAAAAALGGYAVAAGTAAKGTAITAIKMQRSDGAHVLINDTTWTDIPAAKVSMSVPSSESALLLARWSGPVSNFGSPIETVLVRIVVGGAVAEPGDHVHRFTADTQTDEVPLYLERSSAVLGGGTYTVKLQAKIPDGSGTCSPGCQTTYGFGRFHFTVERIRA